MSAQRIAVLALALGIRAQKPASGQGMPDPQMLIAAPREGMASLAYMDGVWRGPAMITLPSGVVHAMTQT